MKKTKKRSRSKCEGVFLWIGIALSGFAFYDSFGKEILRIAGVFRAITKLINPSATYYAYTQGIWTIRLIPVSIIYLAMVLMYRRRLQVALKTPLIIASLLLVFQFLVLAIALYNYGICF